MSVHCTTVNLLVSIYTISYIKCYHREKLDEEYTELLCMIFQLPGNLLFQNLSFQKDKRSMTFTDLTQTQDLIRNCPEEAQ